MSGGPISHLSAEEHYFKKIKELILPAFVFISIILLMDILQLFQQLNLSIPIVGLYLFGNSWMWCYVSLYYAYLFPAQYYCTLFGVCMGVCGVCIFIQYPLLLFEQNVLHGQQYWTNVFFLVLLTSTYILPIYLTYYYKKYKPEEKFKE